MSSAVSGRTSDVERSISDEAARALKASIRASIESIESLLDAAGLRRRGTYLIGDPNVWNGHTLDREKQTALRRKL